MPRPKKSAVKAPAKKAPAKKALVKKAPAKKAPKAKVKAKTVTTSRRKPVETKVVARKPASSAAVIREPMTKTALVTAISETTELSRKEVQSVFDELNNIIERHVKKRAVGEFTLPGLMKLKVVKKPATKDRPGTNPFTGEPTTFKGKPARNVVKVRPLKKLKDMLG